MNNDGNVGHNGDSIIIVRRKHEDDHGHHGGAWKIAYADFVTAMMAFFLVMWLINAANEKTKAQVASYFNPIKLTDTTTSKKGLNEPVTVTKPGDTKDKPGTSEEQKPSEGKTPTNKPEQQSHFTDEEMFRNPYGILAQLAGQAVVGAPPGHSEKGLAIIEIAAPGQSGGAAYRDPFDPLAWKSPPQPKEPPPAQKTAKSELPPAAKDAVKIDKKSDAKDVTTAENKPIASPETSKKIAENNAATNPPTTAVAKPEAPQIAKAAPPPTPQVAKSPTQPAAKPDDAPLDKKKKDATVSDPGAKMAIAVRGELLQKLKQYKPEESPAFDVKQTKEGVLISLTDSLSFDMFAVGSAEPKPQLVLLMEKVAGTLRDYRGKIVIRGHTDSRRFRNRDYDNWRLSTARAQMAYYMLIRAGVDEGKVERIEGYADRDLKIPDKPESAGNRRIEILLKVDET